MEATLEILRDYQVFFWIAFGATVFLTPLAMRLAFRFNVLDIPDQKLKPHARPIPYLGGAAIAAAWLLSCAAAMITGVVIDWPTLTIIALGGLAMSALGLADDAFNVSPRVRLLIGAIVISAVIVTTGAGLRLFDAVLVGVQELAGEFGVSMSASTMSMLAPVGTALSFLTSLIIVLGACNSANLIDGLDGLCSGVTALISLGYFLLAAHLAVWGFSAEGDPVRLTLSIAMCGASLGFLPWNFNPARIFMGDAGSVLLGYNCGILILLFAERSQFRWVIGALMIFALPVFDTGLAMFRRWRSGRSIFEGDRSHFYDQLVKRGLSVKQTVVVCYLLTCVYAAVGLLVTWVRDGRPVIRTRYAAPLFLAVGAVTALLAWRTGLTHPEERKREPGVPSDP